MKVLLLIFAFCLTLGESIVNYQARAPGKGIVFMLRLQQYVLLFRFSQREGMFP